MDGLSSATAIFATLNTALSVIKYIRAVAGANEARKKLLRELAQTRGLLSTLQDLYYDASKETWSSAMQAGSGSLVEFKELVDEIEKALRGDKPTVDNDSKHPQIRHTLNQLAYRMQDLKWPYTDSKVDKLLERLEQIKSMMLLVLDIDSWKSSRLIEGKLSDMHTDLGTIDTGVKALDSKFDNFAGSAESIDKRTGNLLEYVEGNKIWTGEQERLFRSISMANLSFAEDPNFESYTVKHNTWIFAHSTFNEWLESGETLLLTGGPGTGKSTICRAVQSFLRSGDGSCVVAIDFDRGSKDIPGLREVFAHIVDRMIEEKKSFQKYYNKLMLTGMEPLGIENSLRIIHRARQDFQRFCIILEGLDAWQDYGAVEELMCIITKMRAPLTIFATSRSDPSIKTLFRHVIDTKDHDPTEDIRSYVRHMLEQNSALSRILEEEAQLAATIDRVTELARGVFFIAAIIIRDLCSVSSPERLKEILEQPPSNLEEIITEAYLKIADQDLDRAMLGKRLVQSLVEATGSHPASKVLKFAQSVSPKLLGSTDDQEKKLQLCVDCCNGLVYKYGADVRLAHASVRVYLFKRYPEWRERYVAPRGRSRFKYRLRRQVLKENQLNIGE